ncbi:MAG: RNA 2',3'-cyclic phosphodiesterase [Acidobacteriota bacterium]|nr:RNA 2',3'-cyclic phosphodiesterase [Acidobacteriota bacterium]
MRLFTALELESAVARKVQELVLELKPLARIRWSPPENLHITTKFIGEWPQERMGELREHMPAGAGEIDVPVSGLGFFPNERFPRVFFAGVKSTPKLESLAKATDEAMAELGVPPEKHPYRPHVTLARIPESVRLHGLRDRIAQLGFVDFGGFRAREFALFESRNSRYLRLESFPLVRGAA